MGWIADRPGVNKVVFYGMSGIVTGIFTCISAFSTQFWMLAVYTGAFGISSGKAHADD